MNKVNEAYSLYEEAMSFYKAYQEHIHTNPGEYLCLFIDCAKRLFNLGLDNPFVVSCQPLAAQVENKNDYMFGVISTTSGATSDATQTETTKKNTYYDKHFAKGKKDHK